MRTQIKLTILIILFQTMGALAQSSSGTLNGYITDSMSGENIGFANIALYQNNVLKKGAVSSEEGYFSIKNIQPGYYDLLISHVSYGTLKIENIEIGSVMPTSYDAKLCLKGMMLKPTIITYTRPIINKTELPIFKMAGPELKRIPVEKITDLVSLAPGVQGGHFRGQRETSNAYYVDGVRITGMMGVPNNAIQELTVYTSGIPSEYGDFLGGVVIITTKNSVNPINL